MWILVVEDETSMREAVRQGIRLPDVPDEEPPARAARE